MIMANRYRICAIWPLSAPPGVTPAARAETVVCGEVEVDSGAIEGYLNLEVHVYCLYDGQNNWFWPYITL